MSDRPVPPPGDPVADSAGDTAGDTAGGPRRERARARIHARAEAVTDAARARTDTWRPGRRRFLAGLGAAGVTAAAAPLITTRASFAAQGADTGTLVVMFLRGGMDGLSAVVPADDPDLAAARPTIAVPAGSLLPLDRGFGLHPALRPLHDLAGQGRLVAIPAVATPEVSRSHFQAQDCLERGGSTSGAAEGWLDRVLDLMGPGTTFRAVTMGATNARALAGDQPSVALRDLEAFDLGAGQLHDDTVAALSALYTGVDHPLAGDVTTALDGVATARRLEAAGYTPATSYPEGPLGEQLTEVARLIKSDVGLRVACVDVGGWDMHLNIGDVDGGAMQRELGVLGEALGAFARDLGDHIDRVNVVAMTEFGRRVEQNDGGGADHGHGATVLVLGGGLADGRVHGPWKGLSPDALDHGDVPRLTDYRDVLGEIVAARLGVGLGALGEVFPGHRVTPVGFMR